MNNKEAYFRLRQLGFNSKEAFYYSTLHPEKFNADMIKGLKGV